MKQYALVAALLLLGSLAAAGPRVVSYQGHLAGPGGTSVPDGTYDMRFSIFDDPAAGTQRWTETESVEVKDGLYSVVLGDSTAFGSLFNWYYDLWLEVEVDLDGDGFDAGEKYAPRQRLTSASWAMDADLLQGHSSLYFQRRVTGAAPAGEFIRAINEDGTVVTAPDQLGPGPGTLELNVREGTTALRMINPADVDNVNDINMADATGDAAAISGVDNIVFHKSSGASINMNSGDVFGVSQLRFLTTNALGIDLNQSPIEDADTVAANTYRFNSPTTFHRTYNYWDLVARREDPTVRTSRGAGFIYVFSVDGAAPFEAILGTGVRLPQGAWVTRLEALVFDDENPGFVSVSLSRIDNNGNANGMATAETTDAGRTAGPAMVFDDTIGYSLIRNDLYTYVLMVTLNSQGIGSNRVRFYFARIEFTMEGVAF